jgi:hypothetical protein
MSDLLTACAAGRRAGQLAVAARAGQRGSTFQQQGMDKRLGQVATERLRDHPASMRAETGPHRSVHAEARRMAPATELIICPAVAVISSRARNPHAPRHSPLMPHALTDLVQLTPLGQGKAHSASLVTNLELISCYDISLSQLIRFICGTLPG